MFLKYQLLMLTLLSLPLYGAEYDPLLSSLARMDTAIVTRGQAAPLAAYYFQGPMHPGLWVPYDQDERSLVRASQEVIESSATRQDPTTVTIGRKIISLEWRWDATLNTNGIGETLLETIKKNGCTILASGENVLGIKFIRDFRTLFRPLPEVLNFDLLYLNNEYPTTTPVTNEEAIQSIRAVINSFIGTSPHDPIRNNDRVARLLRNMELTPTQLITRTVQNIPVLPVATVAVAPSIEEQEKALEISVPLQPQPSVAPQAIEENRPENIATESDSILPSASSSSELVSERDDTTLEESNPSPKNTSSVTSTISEKKQTKKERKAVEQNAREEERKRKEAEQNARKEQAERDRAESKRKAAEQQALEESLAIEKKKEAEQKAAIAQARDKEGAKQAPKKAIAAAACAADVLLEKAHRPASLPATPQQFSSEDIQDKVLKISRALKLRVKIARQKKSSPQISVPGLHELEKEMRLQPDLFLVTSFNSPEEEKEYLDATTLVVDHFKGDKECFDPLAKYILTRKHALTLKIAQTNSEKIIKKIELFAEDENVSAEALKELDAEIKADPAKFCITSFRSLEEKMAYQLNLIKVGSKVKLNAATNSRLMGYVLGARIALKDRENPHL